MEALFIHYPKCTTCKKALKYLKNQGINVIERHIVEQAPTEEELKRWILLSGLEFKKFFNTSGLVYKELGLKDKVKTMTEDEAVKLLVANGMLIKRPILVMGQQVCVGFKVEDYDKVINK